MHKIRLTYLDSHSSSVVIVRIEMFRKLYKHFELTVFYRRKKMVQKKWFNRRLTDKKTKEINDKTHIRMHQ